DVNVNLERRDAEMTDAPQSNVLATQVIEDTHSDTLVDVPVSAAEIPPSSAIILPPPPIPLIQHLQQTPFSTTTMVPSTYLQDLPTFGSVFQFEDRVKTLENDFSEFKQTS
ncbi:hypothetical protein Tco_1222106, partial [Tanacetum coccineum]